MLAHATLHYFRRYQHLNSALTFPSLTYHVEAHRSLLKVVKEMDNTLGLLQKFYDRLFTSGTTLSKLRDTTLAERLYLGPTDTVSVAGRSLAWKLFFAKEEPLQASLPPRVAALLDSIRDSRTRYTALLADKTRAPDTIHGTSSLKNDHLIENDLGGLNLNNPLSLHDENPWNEWFVGVELRKVIAQDVERTFPDITFFREADVQAQLTNILFLYSVIHPSIGYRQGMHELLAPLYFAVSFDAITEGECDHYPELVELCSADYVAADAWALFLSVMDGVSQWYEWREPLGMQSSSSSSSGFPNHVHIPNGQNGIQAYVSPIVQACTHIQSTLLRECDPHLWQQMQKVGIEPQIYGIRWLRLLFTREFSMSDALRLWDGLFACDPSLDLARWICVAMLIRIRNELIPGDYSAQLTTLLRYPSPTSANKVEGAPHHTVLLLRQALALQMSPMPATGASIAMENRTLLNISLEVPVLGSPPSTKQNRTTRPPLSSTLTGLSGDTLSTRGHSRQASSPAIGISDMLTRGLVERGESLGINKTLLNAVTEIRRNIPELAASLGVRTHNQSVSSFPMVDERPVEERPPWEPRSRFEIERDISDIRSRDRSLGESLAWIVDALLQDESGSQDAQRIKIQKREALESLSYVRDVLMVNTMRLDEDRLIGGEEKLRRKQKLEKENEDLHAATAAVVVSPPVPVPVVDSRVKNSSMRSRSRPRSPVSFATNVTKGNEGLPRAPWNYTRSSFGSNIGSGIPPELMPRPPPPTSTSLRREGKKTWDDTGLQYDDPLGASRK